MVNKETVLKKNRTVNVKTKSGQNYSYSYATLAQIHEYLENKKLSYEATVKKVDGEDYMFITKISEKGERSEPMQEARIPKPDKMTVQDYGSILASIRRYSLLMAYGLATEDEAVENSQRATPAKQGGNSINFEEIKAKIKDMGVQELGEYQAEVMKKHMTPAQEVALQKIFEGRRSEIWGEHNGFKK